MKFESGNILKYLVENNLYNDSLGKIMKNIEKLDYYLDQDIIEMIVNNHYESELYPAEENAYYYYGKNKNDYDNYDDFTIEI